MSSSQSPLSGSIRPCPFSEGFLIPVRQAWSLLLVYSIYRIALAGLFALLSNLGTGPALLGKFNPESFLIVSDLYLVLTLLALLCLLIRKPGFPVQAQLQISFDIIALTLLMHASGGISSGLGILIAVALAAGGLLVGGRCALLFAAVSTLAVFSEQVYSHVSHAFDTTAYTYTGMLGASFFTISLLAMGLAKRAEQSDAIAAEKAIELADQELLNAHIIDHLQSAIIILDQDEQIQVMNPSALRLFNPSSKPRRIESISKPLAEHFRQWKLDNAHDSVILTANPALVVIARFTRLGQTHKPYHMIFLEDSRLTNQRVQQSKLASLGRLTASIAHEIRNPLAAISHASQLLAECKTLEKQDRRLIEIIREHTVRVNDVIETVLQVSRRRESKPETIDLERWIKKFIADFTLEQQLSESPFQLFFASGNTTVRCDPAHLKQILGNLCCNAMKYGRKAAEPIELKIAPLSSMSCIEVRDHGPGINPDQINQIFEPFFTTSPSGTGLGLYIAKELAELNQSKLEYEPDRSGGSCFRICLPTADNTVIAI
jgi:two-component system sensor histidine kinase PilS (NtrC family)